MIARVANELVEQARWIRWGSPAFFSRFPFSGIARGLEECRNTAADVYALVIRVAMLVECFHERLYARHADGFVDVSGRGLRFYVWFRYTVARECETFFKCSSIEGKLKVELIKLE